MKTAIRLIYLSLFLAGIFSASATMACTTDAWNGGITGTPLAGSPTAVSRVSGECAMQLSTAGSVKDTSPDAEPSAIMRFYVFAQLSTDTPVIFEAFSDDNATASLLTVSFDGSNFFFDAGAGSSGSVPGKSGWNLVELSWTGGGAMDYWVNVDSLDQATTETGSVSAAAGTMESVILGTSDAYTGTLTFDDYEAHRSTPVGALLMGDSTDNGSINIFDIISMRNEILENGLAIGMPDCNSNGAVNVFDIICARNIINQ